MAEEQNSQTVDKPAESAPEALDIDSLLPSIPDFKDLFTEEPPKAGEPEQKPDATPEPEPGVAETALEDVIPDGLKPEGEKPPEPEPQKEADLSESVQKRIDKLTAQKKTAEERATALETELADLKSKYKAPAPILPTAASPLADIETESDLAAKISHIQEAESWCITHLDGGEIDDGKGNKQWLDGNAVKSILANARMMLQKHVPERQQFIASKKAFDAEAKREYPAIFKEGSEPNRIYNQWRTLVPDVCRYPDIALIVGDALVGQQIRLNRAKARNGKSPPGASSPPLSPPAPAASPRVPQNRAASGKELADAFATNPDAALNSFVDSLIEGGAAQRAAKR